MSRHSDAGKDNIISKVKKFLLMIHLLLTFRQYLWTPNLINLIFQWKKLTKDPTNQRNFNLGKLNHITIQILQILQTRY
jgi:hypothetical protein